MKNILKISFTSLIIIATAAALYAAKDWNSITSLFPRVVGFPMLALAIVILVVEIQQLRKDNKKKKNTDSKESTSFNRTVKSSVLLLGWLVGFVLLIWAIGINYAIPIYIFSYMKIQGKYGWLKSAIFAIVTGAFIYALFNLVFRVVWPQGAIQNMLGF
jgi:hypothetical protein